MMRRSLRARRGSSILERGERCMSSIPALRNRFSVRRSPLRLLAIGLLLIVSARPAQAGRNDAGLLFLTAAWTQANAELTPATPLLPLDDQPRTIVCIGDSVTGVYYHTGGIRAYPEMLEIAIHQLRPTSQTKVINAGISGQTTIEGLARFEKDVLAHRPAVITVSFCLNDATRIPLEDYEKNLRELVRRAQAAQSQIVLCTPNFVQDTGGRPITKLRQYCERIHQVGKELKVPVCDQFAAGEAQAKADPWKWRLTLSDSIHPNMDGHKLMAEELCATITGKRTSLQAFPPPAPALTRTSQLLKEKKPVRILAMPPFDQEIVPAIRALHSGAQLEVTKWDVAGKSLAQIEQDAQQRVRTFRPDLVVIHVPRNASAGDDEQFVHSQTWILNWSLSFGTQEWDCFVVHPRPAGSEPKEEPRDALYRHIVRAQHLHLLELPNSPSREQTLTKWLHDVGGL